MYFIPSWNSPTNDCLTSLITFFPILVMSLTLKLLFSLVEIRNIAKAETKKVPASKPKALVTPHLSTIIPPKPKPMIAAIVAVIEIKELAKKIALDHLAEAKDYYTALDKMEEELDVKK